MSVTRTPIDSTAGRFEALDIDLGTIRIQLVSLGAAIRTVEVPDAAGRLGHVHLHLPTPADNADFTRNPHLGSTLGRYANRIADAQFTLDGRVYHLDANNGPNCLHGGSRGFDRHVWQITDLDEGDDAATITFEYVSPDGDMGFPGEVRAQARYEISPGTIAIHYRATTDADTVINMANHGYWNLDASDSIGDHTLRVDAQRRIATDDSGIPTGIVPIDTTAFDFRDQRSLGPAIAATGGIDSCYLVEGTGLREMGYVTGASGRSLQVLSDAPGVQVYTAGSLGAPFRRFQSISLEAQRPPDAPNQTYLGASLLQPGAEYTATTELRFSVAT